MMAGSSVPQPDTNHVAVPNRQASTASRFKVGAENVLHVDRPASNPHRLQVFAVSGAVLLVAVLALMFVLAGASDGNRTTIVVLAAVSGIILGAVVSWLAIRRHYERALTHVENFRRRLMSVERDQALWVSLSAVLHDVRNPMHNVTLLAETLNTPGSNVVRVREQILTELERVNVRMRRVREQISEFSGEIERRAVPLPEVMEQVDDMIGPLASRSGVVFSFYCSPQDVVVADPKFLAQAIDHLLLNSLQILCEQPPERPRRLSVTVQAGGDGLSLLIDDTGPGLPDGVRENPFEPLGVSQHGGMGLGLTIAHALARAAGGELSVAQTGDTGTQFRLRLVPA